MCLKMHNVANNVMWHAFQASRQNSKTVSNVYLFIVYVI